MKVHIHVFAALKEYFDNEFELEIDRSSSVNQLIDKLAILCPESESMLSKCRVAINESIVSTEFIISNDEPIFLLPPSSGG